MNKHMTMRARIRSLLLLAGVAVLLSACEGSRLDSIDAPDSVDPLATFPVTVNQVWVDQNNYYDIPDLESEPTLVFMLFIPEAWSAAATASYSGTFGGSAYATTFSRLPGPVPEDFSEFLIEDINVPEDDVDDFLEEYAFVSCGFVPPDMPDGFQALFYLANDPLPDDFTDPPELSQFTVEVTSGAVGGQYTIGAQHGLRYDTEETLIDSSQVYARCENFEGDDDGQEGAPLPDRVFADIGQFETFFAPVPIAGATGLIGLALVLMLSGWWLGRRRLG